MTNVHPFPKRPAAKKARRNPSAASGPAFTLPDLDGVSVDALTMITQAGSIYLTPTDENPAIVLPTAQLRRTIAGLDALFDAANILVMYSKRNPEGYDQEATDQLVLQRNQIHKVVHRLYDRLPPDDFILSVDSYGPDLMVEYATYAAMGVTASFALYVLNFYHDAFIKTGKDPRKAMFKDFQAAYLETREDCLSRSEGHEFLIKELTSANKALQKVIKEL